MPFSESCELLLAAACLVAALVAHQERHHWRVLGLLLIASTSLVGSRLAVGLHGEWLGIQRQDLSHLLLMLAILSWMLAQLDGTRWARSPSPFLTS